MPWRYQFVVLYSFDPTKQSLQMMTDPEAQQFVSNAGNAGEDFDLKKHGYVFNGRVVTKIDKSV